MVMQTIEERINEKGTIIFQTVRTYKIGAIVSYLISHLNDVQHPFKVFREASREEYLEQLREMGAPAHFVSTKVKFYEVTTD